MNKFTIHQIEEVILHVDVVINCADYPDINTTAQWVSEICLKFNKPHIIGGGFTGHIGLIGPMIIPKKTLCWQCINKVYEDYQENNSKEVIINTRKSAGAIGILSSLVASLQSWECIKLLTGLSDLLTVNRRGFFNISTFEIEWLESHADESCLYCKDLI
ncbi:HesA/MoeB/ThiF family protein [Streptococcus rifensis]